MLNEKKDIDQLFRDILGEYRQDPPMYLWTNIQGKLNSRKKEQRFLFLRIAGIAAAIILAFLAGWYMTNPDKQGPAPQNTIATTRGRTEIVTPETDNAVQTEKQIVAVSSGTSVGSFSSPKVNPSQSANLSSLATFAPGTSLINDHLASPKGGELVLFDTEKDFLDHFNQNLKIVKQFAAWIISSKKDSVKEERSLARKTTIEPNQKFVADGHVALTNHQPSKSNGKWSLKAEFSPVFTNQAQNTGQSALFESSFISGNTANYQPQQTNSEKTLSGGMMAGYKVHNRLIIKSGVAFNSIRQTTSNVGLMSVNPLYSISASGAIAATPAGQVTISKVVGTRVESTLNSGTVLGSSSSYAVGGQLKQDMRFIEIPVQATYKLLDRKVVSIGLTGGVSTNILVGNKAVLTENGTQVGSGETSGMRNVVYSGSVGLEMGYEVTNRITLTVEPRIKRFLNSLSNNKSVNYKPSQVVIVTGLAYSFN